MIILILTNSDIGLYKFRKELIQELINKGNQVFIGLPNGPFVCKLIQLGCNFSCVKLSRRSLNLAKDILLFFRYLCLIKKIRPDIVITYTIKPNLYAGLATIFCKKNLILNITGLGSIFQNNNTLKQMVSLFYRFICSYAKLVFFGNQSNRDFFLLKRIVSKKKSIALNGAGVNLHEFAFCKYPEDNTISFLFIGRIMKDKGINELLNVAQMIKRKNKNVIFNIVGPLEENYQPIIQKLFAQKVINYFGFQSDIVPFISKAHCIVLPSYHEGMSNVLLEAGAIGRPLITTNIPGCMEAVIDNKSGYLINPKNTRDLYIAISKFIKLSQEEKAMMGIKSRRHIETNFNRAEIITDTLRMIKSAVQ